LSAKLSSDFARLNAALEQARLAVYDAYQHGGDVEDALRAAVLSLTAAAAGRGGTAPTTLPSDLLGTATPGATVHGACRAAALPV
jgi:hypothetical protein